MCDDDYMSKYQKYLEEFVATVNPDDQLPIHVAGYKIYEDELPGSILHFCTQYLTLKDCPRALLAPISNLVLKTVTQAIVKLPNDHGWNVEENYFNGLRLMQSVTSITYQVINEVVKGNIVPNKPRTPRATLISTHAVKNNRRAMEDRHVAIDDLDTMFSIQSREPTGFYAIYDGHGGVAAAAFSAAHLHQQLVFSDHYLTDLPRAITDAFLNTDVQFIRKCNEDRVTGGTTALAVVLRGRQLVVAWAGDSQAVLVKSSKVMTLVRPHRADREDERDRVTSQGGHVVQWGTWRVGGQLTVTRAIGDSQYKPYVSAKPEVLAVDLDGHEDFVVLASDGLWDVLEPDTVALTVYQQLLENIEDINNVSRFLVKTSQQQSAEDNVSVIVVVLREPSVIAAEAKRRRDMYSGLEGPETAVDPPTPPESTALDNVAESGEESEDEWNYYAADQRQPEHNQSGGSLEDMSSPLNPDAPAFVPCNDTLLAASPHKPLPVLEPPDSTTFEHEASERPNELDVHHNGDVNGVSSTESSGLTPYNNHQLLEDLERVQKDTTDFCDIKVSLVEQTDTTTTAGDTQVLERLMKKEQDPMTMSFYQQQDDLNAVHELPSDDEVEEDEVMMEPAAHQHSDDYVESHKLLYEQIPEFVHPKDDKEIEHLQDESQDEEMHFDGVQETPVDFIEELESPVDRQSPLDLGADNDSAVFVGDKESPADSRENTCENLVEVSSALPQVEADASEFHQETKSLVEFSEEKMVSVTHSELNNVEMKVLLEHDNITGSNDAALHNNSITSDNKLDDVFNANIICDVELCNILDRKSDNIEYDMIDNEVLSSDHQQATTPIEHNQIVNIESENTINDQLIQNEIAQSEAISFKETLAEVVQEKEMVDDNLNNVETHLVSLGENLINCETQLSENLLNNEMHQCQESNIDNIPDESQTNIFTTTTIVEQQQIEELISQELNIEQTISTHIEDNTENQKQFNEQINNTEQSLNNKEINVEDISHLQNEEQEIAEHENNLECEITLPNEPMGNITEELVSNKNSFSELIENKVDEINYKTLDENKVNEISYDLMSNQMKSNENVNDIVPEAAVDVLTQAVEEEKFNESVMGEPAAFEQIITETSTIIETLQLDDKTPTPAEVAAPVEVAAVAAVTAATVAAASKTTPIKKPPTSSNKKLSATTPTSRPNSALKPKSAVPAKPAAVASKMTQVKPAAVKQTAAKNVASRTAASSTSKPSTAQSLGGRPTSKVNTATAKTNSTSKTSTTVTATRTKTAITRTTSATSKVGSLTKTTSTTKPSTVAHKGVPLARTTVSAPKPTTTRTSTVGSASPRATAPRTTAAKPKTAPITNGTDKKPMTNGHTRPPIIKQRPTDIKTTAGLKDKTGKELANKRLSNAKEAKTPVKSPLKPINDNKTKEETAAA